MRSMQIRRSAPFSAKSVDPRPIKKATCLVAITWYNSNNSLTPEFKRALFEKRNNFDELINIPTKAEERSIIQSSFRTQDLTINTGTIWNPRLNSQLIHEPLFSKSANLHGFSQKSTIRGLFEAKSAIQKPFHPSQLVSYICRVG